MMSDLANRPLISVIVPFYHNILELDRCLEALKRNDLSECYEMIVVDDHGPGEPQLVAQLVTRHGGQYYRQPKNRGPGVARNWGAQIAKGRTLVFIDSDCVPPTGWLAKLLQPIQEGITLASTSCYSGPTKLSWITIFQNEDYLYRMPSEECDTFFLNSCNLAIQREAFLRCGGFPRQRVSEDMVLGMRLAGQGTPARYLPQAGVEHAYHSRLRGYLKQRFAFAFNTMRSYLNTSRWRPENTVSVVRSFNPLRTFLGVLFSTIMIISFTIMIVSLVTSNHYALLFAFTGLTALILEVLVHASFLFFLAKRQGTIKMFSYILLLIAIDIAYTNGVVAGTIAGLLDRLHFSNAPLPVSGLANSGELLDTEDE